jgi:dTDP-4-amino-4,6-dideoxygalactose transaminase
MTGARPMSLLQVGRPILPRAEMLLPYLQSIDEARWYTNHGPLTQMFEARLAEHFRAANARAAHLATVASGTAGLILALRAVVGERRGICLLPSWTFAATACAVSAAGLTGHFVDVEPDSWLIDRRQLTELLAIAPTRYAVLLLVRPAGSGINADPWRQLAVDHGVALVVDAADCFDCVRPEPAPQVVSLHATKAFGIGEGGFVLSSESEGIETVRRLGNFGFARNRMVDAPGINGKMSEYAAAVGLAALDAWPHIRARWRERADAYRRVLATYGLDLLFPTGSARGVAMVDLGGPHAAAVAAELLGKGVETRRWWGEGCHRQPAFADWPRNPMPVTESLAARVLGVPFHLDLTESQMNRIGQLLARSLLRRKREAGILHREPAERELSAPEKSGLGQTTQSEGAESSRSLQCGSGRDQAPIEDH